MSMKMLGESSWKSMGILEKKRGVAVILYYGDVVHPSPYGESVIY